RSNGSSNARVATSHPAAPPFDEGANRLHSLCALAWRRGVDGERVHAAGKLTGKCLVHQAVALEPALSAARIRHDIDPEVGLALRPMAGVPHVLVGFIDDIEAVRGESLGQLLRDQIARAHGLGLTGSPAQRSMPDERGKCVIALVK